MFSGQRRETKNRNDVISNWHIPAKGDGRCPERVNSSHRISHLLLVAQVKIGIVGKFQGQHISRMVPENLFP